MKNITRKPDIDYPCSWIFKVFGSDMDLIRMAVGQILSSSTYVLTPSHSSRHNRYHCMNLGITVMNEEDRLGIYEALNAHRDIILVL